MQFEVLHRFSIRLSIRSKISTVTRCLMKVLSKRYTIVVHRHSYSSSSTRRSPLFFHSDISATLREYRLNTYPPASPGPTDNGTIQTHIGIGAFSIPGLQSKCLTE